MKKISKKKAKAKKIAKKTTKLAVISKSANKGIVITKEIRNEISKAAKSIVNKPNIKKYAFPAKDVEKLITTLYRKSDGKFNAEESYKFSAGYCGSEDTNFKEVNAIISLMKKHRPDEVVVTSLANGMKVLILGEVARELFEKSTIDWQGANVTSAGARIPLKIQTSRKFKCFGGETIDSEIKRQSKMSFPKTWDKRKGKKGKK